LRGLLYVLEFTQFLVTLTILLIITSAVALACVAVNYALTSAEQTLQTENCPKWKEPKNLGNSLLNQTDSMFNGTMGLPIPEVPP
jgi:Trk-type K+ transport system membrane component